MGHCGQAKEINAGTAEKKSASILEAKAFADSLEDGYYFVIQRFCPTQPSVYYLGGDDWTDSCGTIQRQYTHDRLNFYVLGPCEYKGPMPQGDTWGD